MRLLITAAVEEELIVAKLAYNSLAKEDQDRLEVKFCLTGIGMVSTAYHLTKLITLAPQPYSLVINIGIAGTFSSNFPIGSVARITTEYIGDFGVESYSGFQTLFDYKLLDENTYPFRSGALNAPILSNQMEKSLIPYGNAVGVTVNTVTGLPEKREQLLREFKPEIESMEGAAFFYTCLQERVDFLELRAVSNLAGDRDKTNWNIPLALLSLNNSIKNLFSTLITCS